MVRSARLLRYATIALLLGSNPAWSETGWGTFKSETGAYNVLLPNEHDVKRSKMRINNESVVFSEEVSSVLDQRPFRDTIKRYIVKMDQTIGAPLDEMESKQLLDLEVQTYKDYYSTMSGVLKGDEQVSINGWPARDIYISYQDPDFGPQAIRALFMMSDIGKYQQIVMGTDDVMYAYKTKDYFASLGIRRGTSTEVGVFAEDWTPHVAPSQIFTVKLPPVNPPYVLNDPSLAKKEDGEVITDTIFDPVRQEKLYYTITSHAFEKGMAFRDAEEVLLQLHLSKYKINYKGFGFGRIEDGEFPALTVETAIAPPKEIPYATFVRLKATFYANYMVVQEVVGSPILAHSDFATRLMDQITFHPQQAEALKNAAVATPETAPADVPAPASP